MSGTATTAAIDKNLRQPYVFSAAALEELDQIEISQLKTEVATLEKEIRILKDHKDLDQTQIVQLQARVDELETMNAILNRRMQELIEARNDHHDGGECEEREGQNVKSSLREGNHKLCEKGSRPADEMRELDSRVHLEHRDDIGGARYLFPGVDGDMNTRIVSPVSPFYPKTLFSPMGHGEDGSFGHDNMDGEDAAKDGDFPDSDSGFGGYGSENRSD